MGKLPKFTLEYDEKRKDWSLENDKTNRVVRRYDTKDEATAGGVLQKAVGSAGGSVKIQLENGKFEEERTYPKSKDPSESKG